MPEAANHLISIFSEVPHPDFTDALQNTAARAVNRALDSFFCDRVFALAISITDDENIKNLNNDYRGIDRVTDVLSFPQYDFTAPLQPAEPFTPENGAVILGDIIISAQTAISQAIEYNHSLEREFVFLCIHSMLHLLGYDHTNEADTAEMEQKQAELMAMLGIGR